MLYTKNDKRPERFRNLKYIFLILMGLNGCFPKEDIAQVDPYAIDYYEFVNYDVNKFEVFGHTASYNELFNKFDRLVLNGEGQVQVLHIGDSHIQADISSGRSRVRLQTFIQGGVGGRGFVFPCSVIGTNDPVNISVSHTREWIGCRNITDDKNCMIGLAGMSATTYDSDASITIKINTSDSAGYDFNRVKVFHSMDSTGFLIDIDNYSERKSVTQDIELGFTEFLLDEYMDSLVLKVSKTAKCQDKFVLHGVSLETGDPGVIYHSSGVNGARTDSFLRCNLLGSHLKTIRPDWVIISLGTNDAFVENFNKLDFALDYHSLITKIQEALPGIPILLTVPGDSYLFRKIPNKNTEQVSEVILHLAEKHNCAVWDFYNVMGGFSSVDKWNKEGLAADDKLHLTRKGYLFQGDLFFIAFLKMYDSYIDRMSPNNSTNH